MSTFTYRCPHCGRKNRHRESSAGTIARCEECRQKYEIPNVISVAVHVHQPAKSTGCFQTFSGCLILTLGAIVLSACLLGRTKVDPPPQTTQRATKAKVDIPTQEAPPKPPQPREKPAPTEPPAPVKAEPPVPAVEPARLEEMAAEAARIEKLTKDENAAASRLRLAKGLLEDGRTPRAIEWLEEIVEKYPNTNHAHEARELLNKVRTKKPK